MTLSTLEPIDPTVLDIKGITLFLDVGSGLEKKFASLADVLRVEYDTQSPNSDLVKGSERIYRVYDDNLASSIDVIVTNALQRTKKEGSESCYIKARALIPIGACEQPDTDLRDVRNSRSVAYQLVNLFEQELPQRGYSAETTMQFRAYLVDLLSNAMQYSTPNSEVVFEFYANGIVEFRFINDASIENAEIISGRLSRDQADAAKLTEATTDMIAGYLAADANADMNPFLELLDANGEFDVYCHKGYATVMLLNDMHLEDDLRSVRSVQSDILPLTETTSRVHITIEPFKPE